MRLFLSRYTTYFSFLSRQSSLALSAAWHAKGAARIPRREYGPRARSVVRVLWAFKSRELWRVTTGEVFRPAIDRAKQDDGKQHTILRITLLYAAGCCCCIMLVSHRPSSSLRTTRHVAAMAQQQADIKSSSCRSGHGRCTCVCLRVLLRGTIVNSTKYY